MLNGKTLPETAVVLISSGPEPEHATCAMLLTSGLLVVDSAANTFSIKVNVQSCSGQQGVFLTESGTYAQTAASLAMLEPFPDHVATLTGQIDARSISIQGVFFAYTFAR
jgi:hypothetical protein